jgi:hypothetical protein
MEILGERWVWNCGVVVNNCIRWLGEEEGWFTVRIETHLAGVFGIIAAYAKNSAYWKALN